MLSPSPLLPTPTGLCAFLQARFPLPPSEQKSDVATLWRPPLDNVSSDPIEHLTLALDFRALANSTNASRSDGTAAQAFFLHRPFDLPADFWPGVPVFASHRGLDAHLSVGWNPVLAQTLQLQNVAAVYRNPDDLNTHPVGMIGDLPEPVSFADLLQRFSLLFGGMETGIINGRGESMERLAIMGAMTPALVRQASEAGATGYLTGQVRDVARDEAVGCGLAIFATGHQRAELWGLHQLARELQEAFPALQTRVVQ